MLRVLFDSVTITPIIAKEYQELLPDWIHLESPNEKSYRAVAEIVDEGEASAIALILEKDRGLLILDDIRARKYAKKLGLNVTGTIGVIAKAEKAGKIASAMSLIKKIQETNFRLSKEVVDRIRKELEK